MQILRKSAARAWLTTCVAALAGLGVLAASADPTPARSENPKGVRIPLTMRAGTVYNLTDAPEGASYLYDHEVRGIAQVSHLGNCKVHFDVHVAAGGGSGHALLAAGTLVITTLAGDKLVAQVDGWADPDPNGPGMFSLHYEVTITGGTGKLAGARGRGEIDGAFMFSGEPGADADLTDDKFCTGYVGVATWQFEGVVTVPRSKK
jgi:hypothetical protein